MQFWQNQYSRNTIVLANFNADLLRGFFFEWFLCLLRQAKGICYSRSFLFVCLSLCEKCPNTELFLVCIFHIRTEYIKLRSISPYPVRMRENADQKNSVFGHFSRSERVRNHPFGMYAKFSQKLTFLRLCINGKKVSISENFSYILNGWSLTSLTLLLWERIL